ncbi:hypothetical protein KKG22_02300 [Patescibacteria group bacterium]|nr:hypothetical protein [Patescibacteria group bacterium]MBU1901689.1 hypothetical protein [Patescibacteria group bacterium]
MKTKYTWEEILSLQNKAQLTNVELACLRRKLKMEEDPENTRPEQTPMEFLHTLLSATMKLNEAEKK